MTPAWSPPVIISPRRLALSAHVRAAVEQLRPDVVCLPDAGMGELVAGLVCEGGRRCGPHLIVGCEDPALRAVWATAQRGGLTQAADAAIGAWRGAVDNPARTRIRFGARTDARTWAWFGFSGEGENALVALGLLPSLASWAIAAAAGAGAWSRDADGRFNAQLASGELTERIFPTWRALPPRVPTPGFMSAAVPFEMHEPVAITDDMVFEIRIEDGRTRAEAADAWARDHVAGVFATADEAFGATNARTKAGEPALLVLDGAAHRETAIRAIGADHVHVLAFATDATIDAWAPPSGYTLLYLGGRTWQPCGDEPAAAWRMSALGCAVPQRCGGLTWTRENGDWIGRSF